MTESNHSSSTARAYASFTPTWQRFNVPSTSGSADEPSVSPRSVSNPNGTDAASANPYLRQYSHMYSRRLAALRDRCLDAAKSSTTSASTKDNVKVVSRILELQEDGRPSTIVGTVAKEMSSRPSVDTGYHSSAISSSSYLGTIDPTDLFVEPLGTYCSPATTSAKAKDNNMDKLYLEDESGRIELQDNGSGVLNIHELCTGVVMGVTGVVKEGTGIMIVRGVHLPGDKDKKNDTEEEEEEDEEEEETKMAGPGSDPDAAPYILLISGLGCGASNVASTDDADPESPGAEGSLDLRRDLVLDYLAGHSDPNRDGARVARVVVAGGGCASPQVLEEIRHATKTGSTAAGGGAGAGAANVKGAGKGGSGKGGGKDASPNDPSLPIKELDLFLSELCASGIPIDYLPGLHDPTTAVWPQRPIHPCLLPKASTFEGMLKRSPNPYEAKIGGKLVLGTDGRNVADLRRYMAKVKVDEKEESKEEESTSASAMEVDGEEKEKESIKLSPPTALEALESTLTFAHIAPTGPDSLPTYPGFEHDPFVMEDKPEVYFAGNCSEYATKMVGDARLICVPSFDATGQAVLVNIETLDCEVISFADA